MDTRETYIVVDELDAHLETGPLAWSIQPLDNDYGPTHSFPMFSVDISDPSTAGPPAWVAFQFDGTSINLRGTTSEAPQDFLVSIDGATPYNTSTGDRTPQTYLEWFQSPMHPQGNHKMNISNIRGTAIDVLLITPGPDTALLGKTLLVDDISPDIKFLGRGWKTSARPFKRRTNTSKKVTQPAIQNGTHETSTIGDGLFFAFTGTRARLYGIVPSSPGGSYMLTTSVDNGPPKLENLTYTRPNTNSNGDSPNDRCYHLLADTGDLAEGSHGFEVRLNETKDAPFIVDYILYDPTFSTLATKPDLSAMEPSPPSSETQPPSPSATSIDPGPLRSKVNIGAVVGGVVGIVTFAVVTSLIFLLLWRKRNRRRRGNKLKDEDSLFQHHHSIRPFTTTTEVPLPDPYTGKRADAPLISAPLHSKASSSASGSASQQSMPAMEEEIALHVQELQNMLNLPGGPLNQLPQPRSRAGVGDRMSVGGESTAPPAYQSVAQ